MGNSSTVKQHLLQQVLDCPRSNWKTGVVELNTFWSLTIKQNVLRSSISLMMLQLLRLRLFFYAINYPKFCSQIVLTFAKYSESPKMKMSSLDPLLLCFWKVFFFCFCLSSRFDLLDKSSAPIYFFHSFSFFNFHFFSSL